jgi:F0F1-type ATP synthase assembly protein I
MHPTDKAARVAGAIYLLLVVTAPFSLMYVPSKLIARGNATATASNILTHEMLFRFSIVADLISTIIFISLGIALYRLLNGVNKTQAWLMMGFVLVSSAVGFMNVLNNVAALILFRGGDFLAVFQKPQLESMGMLFLRLHDHGIMMDEIFWGLWLLPFGVLVMQSRFLPRILGAWLILNGFAYMALSFTSLLVPQYQGMVYRIIFPVLFGEMAIMLWLVIKGANVKRLPVPAG